MKSSRVSSSRSLALYIGFHAKACHVEGAIATIQAAFAVSNVLTIESSNEMLQGEQQNFASKGRLARH